MLANCHDLSWRAITIHHDGSWDSPQWINMIRHNKASWCTIILQKADPSWQTIMIQPDGSSFFIGIVHYGDASSWSTMVQSRWIMMTQHDESPGFIMMNRDASSWWFIMMNRGDSSWYGVMFHYYEERVTWKHLSGLSWSCLPWGPSTNAMHRFMAPMAFFQAEG